MSIYPGVLNWIHQWDVFTFRRIHSSRRHKALVSKARQVSRTGDGWLYPFTPVVVYAMGHPLAETFFLGALIAFGVERLVYMVAKKGFRRRRPGSILPGYTSEIKASDEFSFPSGHTSAAFLMVTLLVMFFGWPFAVLYIWACAVAFSRIVLGVHFPTDTMVGAVMGITLAFSVYATFMCTSAAVTSGLSLAERCLISY